jgi:hypothetical protein
MATVPKPRGMVLEFLENLSKSELPLPSEAHRQMYLRHCLREALEGLHALGYGEATPIFTPRKTSGHGVTPYSALKYRMKAVGFVDLYHNKGYLVGKAKATVAHAYGVSVETIKDWEQDPGKNPDPWMQRFRKEIADSTDWSHTRIREALSEAAKRYVVANKKKKVVKQEKKQKKKQEYGGPSQG